MRTAALVGGVPLAILLGCGAHSVDRRPGDRVVLLKDHRHLLVRQFGAYQPDRWEGGVYLASKCTVTSEGVTDLVEEDGAESDCFIDYVVIERAAR